MAKQFKVKSKGRAPIPFDLCFERKKLDDDGEPVLDDNQQPVLIEVTESFLARGEIPGALMLEIAGAPTPAAQVAGMLRFLHQVIVPEDRDRFDKTLQESDPPVDSTTLGDIAEWLVEVYGENPTG